jgi:quercetin dioxygenase-like cupin family protein
MTTMELFQDEHIQAGSRTDWRQRRSHINCARCGGLMVDEQHVDLSAQRCVQCGEIIDPVILQNRQRHQPISGARRSMPAVAMRSVMLLVSLAVAGMSTPAGAAGQALQARSEGIVAAAPMQDQAAGVAGTDWKVITVELKPGAVESWQSRPEGELLYVLEGSGRLEMGGKQSIALSPGIVARLDARPRHAVKNTSGARTLKVLVVFLPQKGHPHPLLAERMPQGQRGKDPMVNGAAHPLETRGQQESMAAGLIF